MYDKSFKKFDDFRRRHPFFGEGSAYLEHGILFGPEVLGCIHNEFYNGIETNGLGQLVAAVKRDEVLPYMRKNGRVHVAVKNPQDEKIQKFPLLKQNQFKIHGVNKKRFEYLTNMLIAAYCNSMA